MRPLPTVLLCLVFGFAPVPPAGADPVPTRPVTVPFPPLPTSDPAQAPDTWRIYVETILERYTDGIDLPITVRRVDIDWHYYAAALMPCSEQEGWCDLCLSIPFLRLVSVPEELAAVLGHEVGHLMEDNFIWNENTVVSVKDYIEREASADWHTALSMPHGGCYMAGILRKIATRMIEEVPNLEERFFVIVRERLKRLDHLCRVQSL